MTQNLNQELQGITQAASQRLKHISLLIERYEGYLDPIPPEAVDFNVAFVRYQELLSSYNQMADLIRRVHSVQNLKKVQDLEERLRRRSGEEDEEMDELYHKLRSLDVFERQSLRNALNL